MRESKQTKGREVGDSFPLRQFQSEKGSSLHWYLLKNRFQSTVHAIQLRPLHCAPN